MSSEEVCLSGSICRGSVQPGRSLRVSVWHVPHPDMELTCYFWCTADGEPPSKDGVGAIDDQMVEELVRENFPLHGSIAV